MSPGALRALDLLLEGSLENGDIATSQPLPLSDILRHPTVREKHRLMVSYQESPRRTGHSCHPYTGFTDGEGGKAQFR